jgi:radical SAM superfamily enzyme YgiQ (UPF0313 family)
MNILLIEPSKPETSIGGDDVFMFEPLALEYLAAGIPEEHTVKILDHRLEKGLRSVLEVFQPEIVGITAYTIHVNVAKQLFEQVKTWNQDTLTVVGGHHATIFPQDFVTPFINLIVMGEGVLTFREIINRHKKNKPFTGIPGVIVPGITSIRDTVPQSKIGLDQLPFPDRSLTIKYRPEYYSDWMKPLASIRTSKGCPYRCSFCALWRLTGGKYLKRNPKDIVDELSMIEEDFIFFADDESMLDSERMSRLADLIRENGIHKRYFLYARSDTITNNPELFKQWRDIGLERVFVGLEFFKDEDLDYIQKRSTINDNNEAVQILHNLGIDIYASFIIRPEFSSQDFRSLRRYCRQLDLCFASFAALTPLPGTDLYQEVKDKMIIDNYDYFDFIHTLLPTKLPLKKFYQEYRDLYIKGFSFKNHLRYLRKFPSREYPQNLEKGRQFYKRLRNAYRDYQ